MDGIEGGITVDDDGNDNQLKIAVSDISSTAHDSQFFFFRMTRRTTMPVYVRIRVHTPIITDVSVYIDEMGIVQATELYDGGPFVAAFAGVSPAVNEDAFTLTVANDEAGELQTWYERAFAMRAKGFLLPTEGTNLIPDSVIG